MQFDTYLIVDSGLPQTWLGARIIDQLVQALGASIIVEEEMGRRSIAVDISCMAPEAAVATRLFAEFKVYLTLERHRMGSKAYIPWLLYSSGTMHPEPEKLLRLDKIYRQHEWKQDKPYYDLTEVVADLETLQESAKRQGDQFMVGHVQNTLQELHEPEAEHEIIGEHRDFVWSARRAIPATPGEGATGDVIRTGLQLRLSNLWFLELGKSLPAVLAWLRGSGCSDISYEIRQLVT